MTRGIDIWWGEGVVPGPVVKDSSDYSDLTLTSESRSYVDLRYLVLMYDLSGTIQKFDGHRPNKRGSLRLSEPNHTEGPQP